MLRFAVATVVALLAAIALATPAHAFSQLDQANPYVGTDYGVVRPSAPRVGQTFVAGTDGQLTHVRLWLTRVTGTSPVTVELRTFSGSAPGPDVLWSTTLTDTSTALLRLPVAVPVAAGSAYTIVVDGTALQTGEAWRLGYVRGDAYAGGAVVNPGPSGWTVDAATDLAFETYVDAADTTAPSTIVTAGDGAGGWLPAPAALHVAATDDSTGVAETRCWIDPPARPASYAAAGSAACPTTLSGDGVRRVWAASVDAAGNAEVPHLVEVRVGPEPAPPAPQVVTVEVPGPERVVEVPGPMRTVEVPGPTRVETKTETRTVPGPAAPPARVTVTATARARDLVGARGRTFRVAVRCGGATCTATVTAEVRVGRRVVARLAAHRVAAAGGVQLTLTKAQRRRVSSGARVRVTVVTEGAAAPSVTLG